MPERGNSLQVLRSSSHLLAPSILSADFSVLGEQVKAVFDAGAKVLHVDVMDGHFVPNITIGPPVVFSLRDVSPILLDVHLMIENPEKYFDDFIAAGAGMISFHYEASSDLKPAVKQLRNEGVICGVALNPDTPIGVIEEVAEELDFVLLMSVFPGFPGQGFIDTVMDKIGEMKKYLTGKGLETLIEIDGGVKESNIAEVARRGANIIVAGSAVYGAPDVFAEVHKLNEILS